MECIVKTVQLLYYFLFLFFTFNLLLLLIFISDYIMNQNEHFQDLSEEISGEERQLFIWSTAATSV